MLFFFFYLEKELVSSCRKILSLNFILRERILHAAYRTDSFHQFADPTLRNRSLFISLIPLQIFRLDFTLKIFQYYFLVRFFFPVIKHILPLRRL